MFQHMMALGDPGPDASDAAPRARWAEWAEDEDRVTAAAVAAGRRLCFGGRLAEVVAAELASSASLNIHIK
ncbi:hypothetical protein ZWY2020_003858 [Hordeum vulgare]|nr:hypothetical protein ZWY2020_003858 [Hordeum vulgare]